MNDRIRELAREAGIKMAHDETLALGYLDTAHKKFAKLIVRECATIAINAASDTNFATGMSDSDSRALAIAAQINQHFGIKE